MKMRKNKSRKRKFLSLRINIPKRNQEVMGMMFKEIQDNIMKISDTTYSICLEYTDISFAKADIEEVGGIFLKWVDYLNSFNESTHIQVNNVCTPINTASYRKEFLYHSDYFSDNEQQLADEFNTLINQTIGNKKNILQSKRYITLSQSATSFDEASTIFLDLFQKSEKTFRELKSNLRIVPTNERLTLLHDFWNIQTSYEKGIDNIEVYAQSNDLTVFDVLAPQENMNLSASDYIEITPPELLNIDSDDIDKPTKKFIRCLYIDPKFPKSITPKFYNVLTNINDVHMVTTINIQPVETIKAIKPLARKQQGFEQEKFDRIYKLGKKRVDYNMLQDRRIENSLSAIEEIIYDVSRNDQKVFRQNILVCIIANTYAELENQTSKVQNKVGEMLIDLRPLKWQQLEGIQNALPLGHNTLQFQKLETSEATAVHVPFNTKDYAHPHSIFYGRNTISQNPIFLDRPKLMNGNGCILATSGAGKSFQVKTDIEQYLLRYPDVEAIIIDFKKEYEKMVKWFNGQIISISESSHTYINPLDIDIHYTLSENGTDSPIKAKVEYMQSWIESILDEGSLTPITKTIVDRCVKLLYAEFDESNFNTNVQQPTLKDLHQILQRQEEKEAKNLAKALERFVFGTMDLFAHQTNIDIKNRVVSFDLSNLQKSIQTAGYLVVLDHIMHRIAKNRECGKMTLIYIDEFHILFENPSAAQFVSKLVKIGRQFGAFPTVITQNIMEMLNNEYGHKILGNVEFAIILKQNATEREEICKIFNISSEEAKYISNDAKRGQGIIVYGNDKIPFYNPIAKDTLIYELNNTDLVPTSRL